jgi:hypothetical protein
LGFWTGRSNPLLASPQNLSSTLATTSLRIAMSGFIAFALNLIGFGLIAMILVQGFRRKVDFICYRNFYLIGFIFFQVFSGSSVIAAQNFGAMVIENPRAAYTTFLLYTIVFLAIFLLSYHKMNLVGWAAGVLSPKRTYTVNDWLFLMAAVALTCLGLAARFGLARVPGFNFFFSLVPVAPLACAMVGWVWGGRRLNFAVLAVGGITVAACLFLTLGLYGRRPLVAACMALLCGAYFRMRLTMTLKSMAVYLIPIVLGMVFVVGSFSIVRGLYRDGASPVTLIRSLLNTRFSSAVDKVTERSPDAAATIWAIDAYPKRLEQKTLFSLKYMLYHPIPRDLWDEHLIDVMGPKPVPLALEVAELARIKGVAWGRITIPPGVLGYAQAEGGFIVLLLYAVFFGQFCRFFDEIIRRNPTNPFMLLAVVCTLGDLIGLPRGDIAIFANFVFLGFVGDYLLLLVIRLFIGQPQEVGYPGGYYIPPNYPYAASAYR